MNFLQLSQWINAFSRQSTPSHGVKKKSKDKDKEKGEFFSQTNYTLTI